MSTGMSPRRGQKAPRAKRCIKTPHSVQSMNMMFSVRKHRAPKGALRRWSSSSRGRFLSCQKAPSPKRCIKTAPSRCAQVEVPARQKAPRVKRRITMRRSASVRWDRLSAAPARTQPRPPRHNAGRPRQCGTRQENLRAQTSTPLRRVPSILSPPPGYPGAVAISRRGG